MSAPTTPHILSRDEIRTTQDITTETVEVPEWSGSVVIRALTGTDRDAFESSLIVQKGRKSEVNMRNLRAKLVAMSVIDDKGNLLFTQADIEWLGEKSAAALDRIYSAAQKLSRLSAEDIEELTVDLGNAPSGGSGSDSPSRSDTVPSLKPSST